MLLRAYFSKAGNFHAAIENSQLLQYGHAYQLNDHTNMKMMDVHTRVLWNSAKMETFAPQNDRATERNINFLLTATVALPLAYIINVISLWQDIISRYHSLT